MNHRCTVFHSQHVHLLNFKHFKSVKITWCSVKHTINLTSTRQQSECPPSISMTKKFSERAFTCVERQGFLLKTNFDLMRHLNCIKKQLLVHLRLIPVSLFRKSLYGFQTEHVHDGSSRISPHASNEQRRTHYDR